MPPNTLMVARLKGLTAVSDLVGAKIYPMKAPQKVALPYVTYQQISRVPANHAMGTTSTNFQRIQVDCWASSYDGAQALAAAVRGDEAESSPTGLAGWIDGNSQVWHLQNEMDDIEPITVGRDEFEAHRVIQEYFV